jgi:predicted nucleic acid-binding protein
LALSVYLDASVLVSFFIEDAETARAERFLRSGPGMLVVSDFGVAEFASAVGRKVRERRLRLEEGRAVLADFEAWTEQVAVTAETTPHDIAAATRYLKRLDLTLRAPDAINIALSQRLDAAIVTFDKMMARAVRIVGATVVAA